MLVNLHVKNLALIEEAEVEFGPGLNILTGETGAGKSILLGSIQLILGGKMTRSMIRANADYALVELLFQVENQAACEALKALDLEPEDGQILLSRKMMEGRSINKINGQTTTVGRMKEAAAVLLDIHGQHEHQSLLYPDRQLQILDAFGKEEIGTAAESTAEAFKKYRTCVAKMKALDMDAETRSREIAYLEFELGEIEKAALKDGEDEQLEAAFRRMSSSQKIREALSEAAALTGAGEGSGASMAVSQACRVLRSVGSMDPEAEGLARSLEEIDSLLTDFCRELSACMDDLQFDEEDFYQVSRRLDMINGLKSRYGQSVPQILAYADRQQARLNDLMGYEQTLEELKNEQRAARGELDRACRELSERRRACARELEEKILAGLKDLNFADVKFAIRFSKRKTYSENGFDEISYEISTNPGAAPGPLADIVSGGELSRIMLAIKAILADKDQIETLIFDEIDTGISGRTAQKVSEKMALIGRNHQILCITHLPQIAAMADYHFEIEKHTDGETTVTQIHLLDEESSIRELARLLSGASLTEAVLRNAAEMKRLAKGGQPAENDV